MISYYLHIIENKDYQREIAKKMIKEYSKDNKNIVEILACYFQFIINYIVGHKLKSDIEKGQIKAENYFKKQKKKLWSFLIF